MTTIVKCYYRHEDGTIVTFSPNELAVGVAHSVSYVHDQHGNMAVVFVEIPADYKLDVSEIGLITIDAVTDTQYIDFLDDQRQANAVVLDDIQSLDVEGLDRLATVTSWIKELIDEDSEAEAMDVDDVEEIDLLDEDYDDVDDPEPPEDDDGESGECYED